ncbi:PA14 domain-containing protein [Luteolibacter sp. Populi]|uniref:PA14 domain-containing protein n=1 Tax=Luteolibacter sp. Populi TaxID=3230487 RepID=UPI003467E49E
MAPFIQNLTTAAALAAVCGGSRMHAQGIEEGSAFGSPVKTTGSMIGIFYDLKQNQKRQPVKVNYLEVMGRFLDSGWDESVLRGFFRGTRPIYATEVFIHTMRATAAPHAFQLADVVQPSYWFVIYKAQVSPPEDGTYRFVGIADDVMAVAVNGKTTLVSNWESTPNRSKWQQSSASKAEDFRVWAGPLRHGDWFEARKGQPIDLDILMGEYPGNIFGAWLLIEKQGATYSRNSEGKPELPVFQVRAKSITAAFQDVPFTTNSPPWTCHE